MDANSSDSCAARMSVAETEAQLTAESAQLKLSGQSLVENTVAIAVTKPDCQLRAAEFQVATKRRSENQEAVAEARSAIADEDGRLRILQLQTFHESFPSIVSLSALITRRHCPIPGCEKILGPREK